MATHSTTMEVGRSTTIGMPSAAALGVVILVIGMTMGALLGQTGVEPLGADVAAPVSSGEALSPEAIRVANAAVATSEAFSPEAIRVANATPANSEAFSPEAIRVANAAVATSEAFSPEAIRVANAAVVSER